MGRSNGSAAVRPLLLPLVYVATLSLAGVACLGLAVLGSEHVRATALETTASADRAALDSFIGSELTADDLASETISVPRGIDLDRELDELARAHGFDATSFTTPDGRHPTADSSPATSSRRQAMPRSSASAKPSAATPR